MLCNACSIKNTIRCYSQLFPVKTKLKLNSGAFTFQWLYSGSNKV